MDSDTSDILGGPVALNARDSQSGWWSSLPFGAKSLLALIVFFVLYAVGVRVRELFLVWREKSYKLSMRRRHGIPDNDHRPFNVAYAAVLRSRQEGEEKARRARLQDLVQDQQSAPPDQDIRQRKGLARESATRSSNPLPGRYESIDVISSTYGRAGGSHQSRPSFASQPNTEEYYNPNPAVRIASPEIDNSPPKSNLSRRAAKYSSDELRRHGFSDDDELNNGNELRGDEEPEWIEEHGSPRGWKRGHGDDHGDEEVDDSVHIRDKRQRKVSLDKSSPLIGEDMDIDEDEDEISALRSFSRGKKRDRAEAGSTFGGDDEDESDPEIDSEQARRRHRKRRTYAKRKSDAGVSSRGTKRDRELGEDGSEDENEDNTSHKASCKKRGKKAAHTPQQDDPSDVSMDESLASSSRGRSRRSIGEEWESNGVKYKIGSNGQRLRQTLVRKERQKFPMPEDSQHPDRQANFEVYVETWLTEEEYREAKDQQLLAWQDSSKPSVEPQTPTIESPEEVPPVAGKDLLWNSTSGSNQPGTSTPRQITPPATSQYKQRSNDLFGPSIASNAGLRINPFVNPSSAGKRVASIARRPSGLKLDGTATVPPSPVGSIVHSLSDSTNNSPRHKAFSKWEKQDLEAKAMMKMRQANRLKEEEKLEKLKKEQQAAIVTSKAIPTITVTKADDAKPTETKQPNFPVTPTADTTKKDVPNPLFSASPAKQTTQPPLFAPPTSQPTTKPLAMPSPASTTGSQPAKPLFGSKPEHLNSFVSFGPPSSTSTSTSTAPATSASTPAPTNLGIPTSKPAFSFDPTPPQAQPIQATQEGGKKSEPAVGGSLLSRLAPSSAPTPAAQPSQAPSAFGFGKPPTAEVSKTTLTFGNSSTTQPSASSQPAAANTGPKFDFGIGKPPVNGAAISSSTAAAKPAASPFAFTPLSNTTDNGSTTIPSTTPASTTTGSTTTAPKFNFSTPSSSASGSNLSALKSSSTSGTSTTVTNGTAASTPTVTGPTPSAFTLGNKFAGETPVTSTPAASLFGAFGAKIAPATSTSTTTPAQSFAGFGAKPNGTSMTAPTQSAFGMQPAAPSTTTAPTQSAFSSGTKPADNSSTPLGFGTQPAASTSAPAPAQSPFATGSSSTPSSTFGSSNVFGSKPNGAAIAPTQSAFGGGFGNLNGASTSSPFGASSAFGGRPTTVTSATPAASKENGSKPIFSFGKPASPLSSTTPVMTPSATPILSTTGATTGAPSAFGTSTFGSSSNSFTFGNAAKNTTAQSQTSQTTTNSPFGKPADTGAFGFGASSNIFSFGKTSASTGQQQQ